MLTISGLLRRLSAVVKAAPTAVVPEEEEGEDVQWEPILKSYLGVVNW
jgi:hypothetical protein